MQSSSSTPAKRFLPLSSSHWPPGSRHALPPDPPPPAETDPSDPTSWKAAPHAADPPSDLDEVSGRRLTWDQVTDGLGRRDPRGLLLLLERARPAPADVSPQFSWGRANGATKNRASCPDSRPESLRNGRAAFPSNTEGRTEREFFSQPVKPSPC